MIYLIGGAPRVGKTTLAQQISARLGIGWISTDLLTENLKAKSVVGPITEWNAQPEAIFATAEWFFPCLERFVWGITSQTESYIIEGVSFLPMHAVKLSRKYSVRCVFLGCSEMTLEIFDEFPGHSKGYSGLPLEMRRQFAEDIPSWSDFIRTEADRSGLPYIDMSCDFPSLLLEAESVLLSS